MNRVAVSELRVPQVTRFHIFEPRRSRAEAQKMTRGGYRPDSVPRGAASIHLGRTLPCGSSSQPGNLTRRNGMRGQATLDPPIWPCSAWGLPCLLRFRRSGALLPHPFTLTPGRSGGGLLSAALSLALPRPGDYPACCLSGVRTFLRAVTRRTPASSSRRQDSISEPRASRMLLRAVGGPLQVRHHSSLLPAGRKQPAYAVQKPPTV